MNVKVYKDKFISTEGLTGRIFSVLDDTASKTLHKKRIVIDKEKKSNTI